ncbi:NAD-dependent epimerase/dehydratase family protein [Haloarcula nitratireducens]|uniref:NAD(P)-dependent oxidoreductase n=1 Tax=Haloarcula nitratireducens TaxID=2487749 RepID=A0AAW4PGU1_9EURY|nr:NAD(P)-dependent oxidoreductase [Halomicroarcula nitratireducens]MBX0296962.1 NAD(P)-dependent oxidoreductase [Halomicroarcula nitratireducens]
MAINTVAVTGGNGRIGEAIIEELNNHEYRTVNLNRGKSKQRVVEDYDGADEYIQTQMLDPGNVYGALAKSDVDAVIHMASIPNPLTNVGYETYESNVMSTYHVLEAASELELEAAVVPSSVNVIGGPFQDPPMEVSYLPVDETHPVAPRDSYAMSKHAIEVTADGFGRQAGPPYRIASLRYPWVATTSELRTTFLEGDRSLAAVSSESASFAQDQLFSYLHVDDAARVARAAIEEEYTGHERFWAVADDTTADVPTPELIQECYRDIPVESSLEGYDALISTEKARQMLSWEPNHSWR